MKYTIKTTNLYKAKIKKLSNNDFVLVANIINRLANGDILEPKYKDHKLRGNYKDFRECHIKPDLLLICKKENDVLILTCVNLGSHSDLF